jgi:hypothetical protein
MRTFISACVLAALCTSTSIAQTLDPGAAAASAPSSTPGAEQTPAPSPESWFKPFAIVVANANFNAKTLVPGSTAYFAAPDAALNTGQFNVSGGNSFFGVDLRGPKVGNYQVNAKVDFDLRGTTPITNQNVFEPLFVDLYLEFKSEDFRFLMGQTVDVISPLAPTTLNIYPLSYAPGSLGFVRPQIRAESYLPMGDNTQLTVQAALASAIQTFKINNEAFARQSGWPDGQLRVAYGIGKPDVLGSRPTEFGVSSHFGRRDLTYTDLTEHFRNTYSINFDGKAQIGPNTKVQGEFFFGQLLADYMGAVFQSFNPNTGNSIAAKGGWAEVEQKFADTYRVHVGYGVDNVDETDLTPITSRKQNAALYANVFYDMTPAFSIAGELALWRTQYFGDLSATPTRLEFSLIYKFLGR